MTTEKALNVLSRLTIENKKIAMEMARNAAIHGDPICGGLFVFMEVSEPFYLGLDYSDESPDEGDVRP